MTGTSDEKGNASIIRLIQTLRWLIVLFIPFLSASQIGHATPKPEIYFSVPHGFYFVPVSVAISSDDPSAKIIFTTDGSAPSINHGMPYTGPLQISTTMVIRAVAVHDHFVGNVFASSYLFPADIIRQSDAQEGYPVNWGKYSDISGVAKADYGMDPEIVNHPEYKDLIIPSLLSVPTVSVATNNGYLFSPVADSDTGGIYIYTGANGKTGDNWERPVSVEYIIPGSPEGFQVTCGMQIQGGASRLAEKNPKHSFRLAFRDSLGPAKLRYSLFGDSAVTVFNGIVLRATFGNSWRHWEGAQRTRATHIQDIWAKDTQLEMGHFSAHSKYVHLYLNGLYWGLYNFSERMDDDFMESYLGGDKSEYDIIRDYKELMSGTPDAWNFLWTAVNGQISDNTVYQKLIGNYPDGTRNPDFHAYIDPVNLCDYMLINFYGGNNDWDHHNWVAARNRVNPQTGFTFFCWDSEKIFENVNENYVNENNADRPSGIFSKLMTNQEFRMLFADRVNLHLTRDGSLTPGKVAERWLLRADEIDTAMVAESARWGDYRRDVHPWSSGPYTLYTVNDHWMAEKRRLLTNYFPVRTQIVLDQLVSYGSIPALQAPAFSQQGGNVGDDFRLIITAPAGYVYYTLDGSDPRLIGGKINPSAFPYLEPIKTGAVTEVRARTKQGNVWSALTRATFYNENYDPPEKEEVINGTLSVFPNPVRASAYIRYSIPERGEVKLAVFRLDGRMMIRMIKGFQEKGEHFFYWNPENLIPGLYILQLTTDTYHSEKKILVAGN